MKTLTPKAIVQSVATVRGKYSLSSFWRDARKLKLAPVGFRQSPQQYPAESVTLILNARGFAPIDTAAARLASIPSPLVSLRTLKRERKK